MTQKFDSTRYDKSIEILSKTNDGDSLEPLELYIVECAVNDTLNTKGWKKFEEIYQKHTHQ